MVEIVMTNKRNRILAVIDPTRHDQWALRRAVSVAENRDDTDVCAFLCVHTETDYADKDEYQSVELTRNTIWLRDVITSFESSSVDIEPVVVWNEDWVQATCIAAENSEINLVIKRASGRPKSLASSDRRLIRKLQREILLVKKNPTEKMEKIVVAVDFNAADASHVALNEAVMALGSRLRGSSSEIELHSVSAYTDSDRFMHPPDIAKALDIDRSNAHVRQGDAAVVIPDMANKVQADLVIVGNVGRRGLKGMTIGNTAEKILAEIESDVVVLVKPEEEQRSAA
jgi:universal stress protein E